ncbi:MAG TPA: hypothetical protein PKA02_04080 [Candidatus Saccharibacteria bacterium]|nr:hypothetical protein [Candidatus Saccharibacteria bacterium]
MKANITKKKAIIIGVTVLIIFLSVLVGILFNQHKKRNGANSSGDVPLLSYEDAVKTGRLSASNIEVLVLNLVYDKTKKPELSVKSMQRFTNSTPNTPLTTASDYKLTVTKGPDTLYTDNFAKPSGSIAESFNEQSKKINGSLSTSGVLIPKIIPWFGDDVELKITDAAGKVILTQSLKDVAVTKNTPDFKTVDGQDVR